MKKRVLALLLICAMVLCLFGCTGQPAPTEPAQTTEATEPAPDAAQIYADACAPLGAADVTLDVVTTKTTTVEDQIFTAEAAQVLTYAGVGTGDLMIHLEETVTDWDYDAEGELAAADVLYEELYTDGSLYVDLESRASFSTEMLAEDAESRYIPAVLLDIALYEDVTVEESGAETVITFAQPTAAESWAVPAEAELVEATGTAVITADTISAMTYTVTYQYGPVTITQTTESKPRAQAETITVPEKTDHYVPMQHAEALRMVLQAEELLDQAQSATVSSIDSSFSQAVGYLRNQSIDMDFHGRGDDLVTKIGYDIFFMDYANNQSESYTQEETYRDGKYTFQANDGLPTAQGGIEAEMLWGYCRDLMKTSVPKPKYWQNVTIEDLGSLYYLEYTFNEDFGTSMQNSVCNTLFGDATLLNNLASAYVTDEITGYLSIDKYTGLFVASGCKYQGTHTIEGAPYVLTYQLDHSLTLPSYGAYKEVTDELLPEEEPEQKATPLFYRVTGADGQEMWLLGTIHVGDERTAYLPQEIYDAFAASDALALECDTEAFDEQVEEDDELQEEVSALYYYSDGTAAADHLDEELHETAIKYMKATGNYHMNADYIKPSIWSSSIDNFHLAQGRKLHSEQGVEERLTKLAKEQEKEILEVESSLFQIKMLTGWSDALQEQLLKESLTYTAEEYYTDVEELYELWCAGDEAAMREELSAEVDTSEMTEEELAEYEEIKPLLEEYNKAMSYDRNEGMLDKAIEYLESGDVIFYAVGLAHLLDNTNGLVDTLREAGYTVELVTYYQ